MKNVFLVLLSFCAVQAFSQNVREINDQVWKPFIDAFNAHDTRAFMAVHSRDVVRSPRDAKVIWGFDEYFRQHQKGDEREKSSQVKRNLDLRFTERIVNDDVAIEVGIYKTSMVRADGGATTFYGRFHVLLRREEGIWKILLDTDSSEGGTISEKDFLNAAPME